MPSAFQLTCPPIPIVRIALIGLGQRGLKTLERYAYISGAEIRYIADINQDRLIEANSILRRTHRNEAQMLIGEDAWITCCQKDDVDLVYVCTEWESHAHIAVKAMECGKHVAVEVPAATTVEECWNLVNTAEKTQRHCFMTENCCYDFFALETLEMKRQGLLGSITHCEGAYIHDLTVTARNGVLTDTRYNWMAHSYHTHGGNPYPTHGIGPIAQLLEFHRKDRMKSLVSITAQGVESNGELYGRVNTSIITTENGVSILLQLDVSTPRPYSRLQTVCGTKGFVQKYPLPTLQLKGSEVLTGDEALTSMKQYATSPAAQLWEKAHQLKIPNEMNYAMDSRLIHCLQNGLPLDMDVYDAAEWSCLAELSKLSAQQGGIPVAIPDFMNKHNHQ